jgi:hypothetical protein
MHETTLLKIALGCILLGLPSLYIISDVAFDSHAVDRITGADVGSIETVTGVVVEKNATALVVQPPSSIVVFPDARQNGLPIAVNSSVRVNGHRVNGTLIADNVQVR